MAGPWPKDPDYFGGWFDAEGGQESPPTPPPHTPRVGFVGLLDFCGYPVGRGPVTQRLHGRGPKLGDRSLAASIIGDLMARRAQTNRRATEVHMAQAAVRARFEQVAQEAFEQQAAHNRCMAVILAEV